MMNRTPMQVPPQGPQPPQQGMGAPGGGQQQNPLQMFMTVMEQFAKRLQIIERRIVALEQKGGGQQQPTPPTGYADQLAQSQMPGPRQR